MGVNYPLRFSLNCCGVTPPGGQNYYLPMRITPHLYTYPLDKYASGHGNRLNLAIHLATAPVFCAGVLALLWGPFRLEPLTILLGAAGIFLAVAAQGFGHGKERVKSDPFLSPADFVARLFVENTRTFWRFVFSGRLSENWRRPQNAPTNGDSR